MSIGKFGAIAFALVVLTVLQVAQARAANIITFDDNANTCGGAVICSFNGTTGYLNNGLGQAFFLSTITSWFQIDTDGSNHLITQSSPEPDGGAGGFLVTNDTGATVTSFSLTITDTFTSTTASVGPCKGLETGKLCDNFQANKGAAAGAGSGEALSGSSFDSCTNGSAGGGFPCESTAGQAAANFAPNQVTYNWFGLDIPAGATFDITFASWNNTNFATPTTPPPPVIPEPDTLALFGTGLTMLGGMIWRRYKAALS